jgi:hypothetical protein
MTAPANLDIAAKHRLTVGSLDGEPIRKMLAGQSVQVVYSDPPWDDAHMLSFANMATKRTGIPHEAISWMEMMRSFVKLLENHLEGWLFLEMGHNGIRKATDLITPVVVDLQVFPTTYGGRKNPNTGYLMVGHTQKSAAHWELDDEWAHGGVRQVAGVVGSVAVPGAVLLDPCCGNGYSAKAALRAGMVFFGNELSEDRAGVTRKILEG